MLSGCILLTHVNVMDEDMKGALGSELLARRARVVCGKAFDFFQIRGIRAEAVADSQQGILCGKTVVWVCGL